MQRGTTVSAWFPRVSVGLVTRCMRRQHGAHKLIKQLPNQGRESAEPHEWVSDRTEREEAVRTRRMGGRFRHEPMTGSCSKKRNTTGKKALTPTNPHAPALNI